jgi:FtsZ-binding cell division protein ZapB
MVEVVETLEAKLKRHEDALIACMAEITKLRAENARLRSSENNAHSVLREIYNDPDAPQGVRVKAAGLALPHEVPRLESVPPPLDLVAEPVEPLADVVARQRARANRLLALSLEERSALITGTGRGNGQDDDTGS